MTPGGVPGADVGLTPPTVPVVSPCSGVCQMVEAVGLCRGCARTLDEIARWSVMDSTQRQRVCDVLSSRRLAHPDVFSRSTP